MRSSLVETTAARRVATRPHVACVRLAHKYATIAPARRHSFQLLKKCHEVIVCLLSQAVDSPVGSPYHAWLGTHAIKFVDIPLNAVHARKRWMFSARVVTRYFLSSAVRMKNPREQLLGAK
uniref:Uncharacterized protein n=1 Tax=Rhodosorus marinus TaxID=101924 RepID=A0A7S0G8L4_9RHOD|mmetsp:Transcript_6746/g.9819  ORF Transcript_6746/g.9819 Transcript_6746/m.9819 type:complete len:121 (+) Transcript_6746:363-725(+)